MARVSISAVALPVPSGLKVILLILASLCFALLGTHALDEEVRNNIERKTHLRQEQHHHYDRSLGKNKGNFGSFKEEYKKRSVGTEEGNEQEDGESPTTGNGRPPKKEGGKKNPRNPNKEGQGSNNSDESSNEREWSTSSTSWWTPTAPTPTAYDPYAPVPAPTPTASSGAWNNPWPHSGERPGLGIYRKVNKKGGQ